MNKAGTWATVHTDRWSEYAGLKSAGFDLAHEAMPHVHTVASLLKRRVGPASYRAITERPGHPGDPAG